MGKTVWDVRKQVEVETPDEMAGFLGELEEICRKYGLVIARNDFGGLSVQEMTDDGLRDLLGAAKEYGDGVDYVGILERYPFVHRAYLVFGNELCVEIEGTPGLEFFEMASAFGETAAVHVAGAFKDMFPDEWEKAELLYDRKDSDVVLRATRMLLEELERGRRSGEEKGYFSADEIIKDFSG